jgi:hypothetical protein
VEEAMSTTQMFLAEEWERLGLPDECECGTVIQNRIVGKSRWSTQHVVVFRLDDQPIGYAWQVHYSRAATESQFEEVPDEYMATLVHAVEKVVTVYEPVP